MKTTKRFFIALLGFCLLGNMLAKADVTDDGFEYDVDKDGEIWIIGYEGERVDSLCFPLIGEKKVCIDFSETANLSVFSEVETLDLRNVQTVWESTFKVVTRRTGVVGFTSLKKVLIGDNTTFNKNSFSGVSVTELVFLGNGSVVSGFSDLASTVTTVDLSSVTTIADNAFNGFAQLQTIKNFENVTSIGASAFQGCTSLEEIDLSNVASIGVSAFQGCGDLATGKGLKNVIWPENLTVFPAYVFSGCAVLTSVSNLDNATEIGDFAFYNCSSTNGTKEFSSALCSVGKGAFMGTNLTAVVVKSNPLLSENAFPAAVALNLEIEDKMAFSDDNENTYNKITYVRDFSSEKFSTLVLPFVPDQIDQLEVYQLSEQNDNNLIFEEVNVFVPGTPYMVKVKGENVSLSELTGTEQRIENKSEQDYIVKAGDWNMIGTYNRLDLEASDASEKERRYYYYTSSADGGKFLYATRSLGVSPFRTYIDGPIVDKANNVRMMTRRFDGMETEIDVVELEDVFNPAMGDFYDLKGCRVLAPVEGGVYIVNGKKIVF